MIYTSRYSPIPVPSTNVFDLLYSPAYNPSSSLPPPSHPSLVDPASKQSWTRSQVYHDALSLSAGLTKLYSHTDGGLEPLLPSPVSPDSTQEELKTPLLIFSPNTPSFVLALLGAFASPKGIIPTLANASYTAPELTHQLADSRAAAIFIHPDLVPILEQCMKEAGVPEEKWKARCWLLQEPSAGGGGAQVPGANAGLRNYRELFVKGDVAALEKMRGDTRPMSEDVAVLCYSSGTTGLSKGVATTHGNLIYVITCCGSSIWPKFDLSDTVLLVLPIFHIFGLINVFICLKINLKAVVLKKFEPAVFGQVVQNYKISFTLLVPPILVGLSNPDYAKAYDLSSLKHIISGAAPLGPSLSERLQLNLPGCQIMQGYGLTETSPICTLSPLPITPKIWGSIGVLCSGLEARLVDDDEKDVPHPPPSSNPDGRGELWIRGGNVMKGYWRNPTATKNSITPDGWFKTGDVAVIDEEGLYYIVDRKKELIKYKGFQVAPAELENLLLSHPSISDAAVIGVYDSSQATEVPRAYIVPAPSISVDNLPKEITDWVAKKVAHHKQLRGGVRIVEVIPKSPAGKILRRQLRDLAAKDKVVPRARL